MGTLQIVLSEPIHTGKQESAVVKVDGAMKGGEVEVTLSQVQGQQPYWGPQTQKGSVDTTGVAFITFYLSFNGPSPTSCLKATAQDSTGTYYEPHARTFEVLP